MSGRLGRAAICALADGHSDVMVGWQPQSGSPWISPHDPHCQVVPLEEVLRETRALLDGTSPVMKWRIRALQEVEGVGRGPVEVSLFGSRASRIVRVGEDRDVADKVSQVG